MEILFGPQIATRLVEQIDQTRRLLVLVTPYFDPWTHLTMAVQRAITVRRVNVILILRGGRDRKEQEKKAKAFAEMGVTIKFVERLHAKLYMCDEVAFVTSLNLLRSSMEGSYELATVISRRSDSKAFQQLTAVVKQLSELVKADELINAPAKSKVPTPKGSLRKKRSSKKPKEKIAGHCLRCNTDIPFNPKVPYCNRCYKSWSKWKNTDYTEKHCHGCGKEVEVSLNKPQCLPCYRASR